MKSALSHGPHCDGEVQMLLRKMYHYRLQDRFRVPTRITPSGHMSIAFDIIEHPSLDITKLDVLKVWHLASLIIVAVNSEGKLKEESQFGEL